MKNISVLGSTGSIGRQTLEVAAANPEQLKIRVLAAHRNVDLMLQQIELYHPDDVAFEELFFGHNVTTGLMVGAARGVAIIAAVEHTDNLYEYTPMQIKQAITGSGRADKHQVQQMVKMLLNMKEIPKPDDAADAIACAITHCQAGRTKEQFRMK